MIKITGTALVAAASLAAGPVFADVKGEQACCAKGAVKKERMACVEFDSMNLTADQKSKLQTWQADCMQAGCTKKSHATFLKNAKGILSADQFARLKEQCGSMKDHDNHA